MQRSPQTFEIKLGAGDLSSLSGGSVTGEVSLCPTDECAAAALVVLGKGAAQ